jgi:glycosyltransferase involved in cell wall biosynthesis
MFAGNIGEAQDFKCILGAAEILKTCLRIRWLIVGDGRMLKWVKNEVKSRGLTESVILLGRYPVERMPEFFVHADAMLVTLSDQEIFSMTIPGKLQSYLAFGLPIIAALNGEGADVIKGANAGFISPSGDSVELAKNVIKMSKLSPAERKELGQNGLRLSENEFSRDKMIGSVETYLTKMWCSTKSSKDRA